MIAVRIGAVVAWLLVVVGCSSGTYVPQQDSLAADQRPADEQVMGRPASASGVGAPRTAKAAATTAPSTLRESDAAAGRFVLAFPTGDRATSILLVEQVGEPQVRVNRPYEYKVTVTNLTDAWLSDVDVRQRAPKYFRVQSSDPPASADGDGQPHWLLGEFGPHEAKSIAVTALPEKIGALASCLSVTYSPTLCTKTEIINPELKLAKQAPSQVDLCEPLVYRYTIRNVGIGPAKNVHIEDALPEGLRTEEGGRAVAIDVGTLKEGDSKEFAVNLKAQRTGEFVTQAVARGDQGLAAETPPISTAVRAPVLAVAVKLPAKEFIDKPVTAQIVVSNRGDAPARSAVLRIDGSNGARLFAPTSAPTTAEVRNSTDTPDRRALGTIEPGASRTVSVVLRGTQRGDARLTATASTVCAPPVATSATIFIQTLPALALECVDSVDPVPVGDNTTYTITVKNQGSGADKNVRVVATLPEEETLIKAGGATAVAKQEGQKLTFEPVAVLAPGDVMTWKVEVRAERAGDVRFRVDLTSDSMTRPAVKEEATRLY
jgi:uncharacterized repeat protein (TIGR01451 family)